MEEQEEGAGKRLQNRPGWRQDEITLPPSLSSPKVKQKKAGGNDGWAGHIDEVGEKAGRR